MKTEQFEKSGDHFVVRATVDHYETSIKFDAYKMYDYYLAAQFEVQVTDNLLEQYRGEELYVSVKGPLQNLYHTYGLIRGTVLDKTNLDVITLSGEHEIAGEPYNDKIEFAVTVSVGDVTETIIAATK